MIILASAQVLPQSGANLVSGAASQILYVFFFILLSKVIILASDQVLPQSGANLASRAASQILYVFFFIFLSKVIILANDCVKVDIRPWECAGCQPTV